MKFRPLFVGAVVALSVLSSGANAEFESKAKQLYIYDMSSQTTLLDKNATERMYPASMTKMMTAYVLFSQIKDGTHSLESKFAVSEKAWRKGGSKMFVELGNQIRLEDLLHGIITQSGNDACIVAAEGVAGSEEAFVKLMNAEAARLGMDATHFMNATGWPDENHYTSARDLAVLAEHLIRDFPEFYPYFKKESFTYHNIRQGNRNLLLGKDLGEGVAVDGLKTGHTEVSGYGMVASAVQSSEGAKGRRVIIVENGLGSKADRASEAEKALRHALYAFEGVEIGAAGKAIASVPVWMGSENAVTLVLQDDVNITLPKAAVKGGARFLLRHSAHLVAPVTKGQVAAYLVVQAPEMPEQSIALVAGEDVPRAGVMRRAWLNAKELF